GKGPFRMDQVASLARLGYKLITNKRKVQPRLGQNPHVSVNLINYFSKAALKLRGERIHRLKVPRCDLHAIVLNVDLFRIWSLLGQIRNQALPKRFLLKLSFQNSSVHEEAFELDHTSHCIAITSASRRQI